MRTLDEKFKQKKLVDRILEDSKEDLIFDKEFEDEIKPIKRQKKLVNKENVKPDVDEFNSEKL